VAGIALRGPNEEVARFVASTYRFDSVEVSTVKVIRQPGRLAGFGSMPRQPVHRASDHHSAAVNLVFST
jgi:hypothetical protein